jgi:hypothetical protein
MQIIIKYNKMKKAANLSITIQWVTPLALPSMNSEVNNKKTECFQLTLQRM